MEEQDGVYILVSQKEDNIEDLEYRVIRSDNIGAIYGKSEMDDFIYPVQEQVKNYFGNCTVYKTEDGAVEYAMKLLKQANDPKVSLGVIYAWANYTFKETIGENEE